jgi:hypothetical protein
MLGSQRVLDTADIVAVTKIGADAPCLAVLGEGVDRIVYAGLIAADDYC